MTFITRRRAIVGAGVAAAGLAATQLFGPGSGLAKGRSRARRIRTSANPPPAADAVIIGGGDAGTAIAYYLAKSGMKVALCEKGAIGGESSCRSVGHIISLGVSGHKLPLFLEAKRLWPVLPAELGIETGYRRNGLAMKIGSEEDRAFWEGWLKENRAAAGTARILDRSETSRMVPSSEPWFGAIYDPTEGSAEPTLVAPAFAEGAARLGAHIVVPCAVRSLDLAAGRVVGVHTERGRIATRNVILAGGTWSTTFMKNLNLPLPIGTIFSWCASFYGASGPEFNAIFDNTTWRRQIDGGFTTSVLEMNVPITGDAIRFALASATAGGNVGNKEIKLRPRLSSFTIDQLFTPAHWSPDDVSPFEKCRVAEPTLDMSVIDHALSKMKSDVRGFSRLSMRAAWGGIVNTTPDNVPVIGPVPQIPGLLLATGLTEGLTMAPAIGKIVSDMVTGVAPSVDMTPFRYGRYG